jgi:hypothetical protein
LFQNKGREKFYKNMTIIKKSFLSIVFGILSLCYFPSFAFFGKTLRDMIGSSFFIVMGFFFIVFAAIGIIFGIWGRKTENKLIASIGLFLSVAGLIITIAIIGFILAFVPIAI